MINTDNMSKTNNKQAAKATDRRKYKDRAVAAPSIPKAGITKKRRRLENGGKATT